MNVEHRDLAATRPGQPLGVTRRVHLHAGAAITFDAVAGAADNQQPLGVRRTVKRHVHRQRFAVAPLERMLKAVQRHAGASGGFEKLGPRAGIAGRKSAV